LSGYRISTGSDPCDTVEGRANGDAAERRSAYAKASSFAEATASAEATAAALCAMAVKTADKSADKYDPPSRLRASAFAEPTAVTSSCPTPVHILQYVYERVQSVLPRMEPLPAHPLKSHPPTHIAICVRARTMCSASQGMFTRASHEVHTFRHILQYV